MRTNTNTNTVTAGLRQAGFEAEVTSFADREPHILIKLLQFAVLTQASSLSATSTSWGNVHVTHVPALGSGNSDNGAQSYTDNRCTE